MSMTVKSFDQILADMKARNTTGLVTTEGSFVDAVLRPVAYALAAYNFDLAAQAALASPQTAEGIFLEMQAGDYGLVRLPGDKATAQVTLAGADGTVIPKGTAVQTKNGLVFLTVAEAVIDGGTATAAVIAETVGSKYNVAEGDISIMQSLATVTVSAATAASGGSEPEADDALRARLNALRADLPASCNAAQYETWAKEVGAGKAKVEGRWNGPGTVKISLLGADMLPAEAPLLAAVEAHIEPLREVCHTVTYAAAGKTEISVEASVSISGTTAEKVQASLTQQLKSYFAELAFTGQPVSYNRIAFILLSIDGVADYTALTVNGGTAAIAVDADAAPVLKAVSVT